MAHAAITPASKKSIERLLRPRSIAIIGASATPGALGAMVLGTLEDFGYSGAIHLVNPNRSEIRNRPCVQSIKALPRGVDCAVLAIPRSGVFEAIKDCGQAGVGGIVIFSAGYSEAGAMGLSEQEEIARIARSYGMAIEGPNCSGMVNYVDGVPLTFAPAEPMPREERMRLAVVSQSGAGATALRNSLLKRGVGISFSVSTGNEAVNGVEDFLEYVLEDESTRAVAMIVEQFREPKRFLELARHARAIGKPIVLLHPGHSEAARMAAKTHTGALTRDYGRMHTLVQNEGVAFVDTLEELTDVADLIMCCRSLPKAGPAIITESGILKTLALDLCDTLGLDLPPLTPPTEALLRTLLPPFITPSNPLDIAAQGLVDPTLFGRVMAPLLADDRYGSIILGLILGPINLRKVPPVLEALRQSGTSKPAIIAMFGEEADVPAEVILEMRREGVAFFRSPERLWRALARLTEFGSYRSLSCDVVAGASVAAPLPKGVVPEYVAKRILAEAGIAFPRSEMVRTVQDAQQAAERIGYPVVLKAQSPLLAHKTDAGGVVLGLADAAALSAGWAKLHDEVGRAKPGLKLDGVLVEKMAAAGLELILGASNDAEWGPVLMVGFGGIWAEALKDVRLLPPNLAPEGIVKELLKLKGVRLFSGFRGAPAVELTGIADMVSRLGKFVLERPEIDEIDINPVVIYPKGQGAVALDALIVTR